MMMMMQQRVDESQQHTRRWYHKQNCELKEETNGSRSPIDNSYSLECSNGASQWLEQVIITHCVSYLIDFLLDGEYMRTSFVDKSKRVYFNYYCSNYRRTTTDTHDSNPEPLRLTDDVPTRTIVLWHWHVTNGHFWCDMRLTLSSLQERPTTGEPLCVSGSAAELSNQRTKRNKPDLLSTYCIITLRRLVFDIDHYTSNLLVFPWRGRPEDFWARDCHSVKILVPHILLFNFPYSALYACARCQITTPSRLLWREQLQQTPEVNLGFKWNSGMAITTVCCSSQCEFVCTAYDSVWLIL
jgi:hypothetical protein